MPEKKMVATVIIAGNRPLHGMKLLVRIATSRSLLESMIRVPTTPAALQPRPMHMESACLPHALHFEKMPSRLNATRGRYPTSSKKVKSGKKIAIGGTVCGVLVIAASIVQQYAIADVEAGKAGFLTTLYILLVPLFSVVFLHKRVAPSLWVSVLLGLTGLYFISVKEGFTISPSDALVLMSAGIYAVYILAADYYVRFGSPTELNCAQFIVASVVCLIGMFAVEEPTLAELRDNIIPILYLGIFSSAIAYTLQVAAQRDGNPVAVTLLLSMESVFSVLGAAVLLHEFLSGRELFGCGIMLCAVILVQLPEGFWKRKIKTNNE